MSSLPIDKFTEQAVQHYVRPALIVVRKPFLSQGTRYRLLKEQIIDNGVGKSLLIDAYKDAMISEARLKRNLYTEFFDKGVIVSEPSLDQTSILDFDSFFQGYFIVSKSIPMRVLTDALGNSTLMPDVSFQDSDLAKNAGSNYTVGDVMSINIDRQTCGISTASVVLKNAYDKYVLSPKAYENQNFGRPDLLGGTIFERNDEISIYLPDLNNHVQIVFKGLITQITQQNMGGFKAITLDCEDFIKNIRLSRLNISPSPDPNESFAAVSAYNPPFRDKKPHEILPYLFSKALLPIHTQLTTNTLDQLYDYVRSYNSANYYEAEHLLSNIIFDHYVAFYKTSSSDILTSTTAVASKDIDRQEITREEASTILKSHYTVEQSITSVSIEGYYNTKHDANAKQTAFKIAGTGQPIYNLQFNNSRDLFLSEWKSSLETIEGIRASLNYLFYTSDDGVVQFHPPDITLSKLNKFKGDQGYSVDQMNSFYLPDARIYDLKSMTDDLELFNYIVVSGNYEQNPETKFQGLNTVVTLQESIEKDKVRMLKNQTVLGLKDNWACAAYGRAILDRQNRRVKSASFDVVGDANLQVNVSVFVENTFSIYYVERLVHKYDVGGKYVTSVVGTWGRKPLTRFTKNQITGSSLSVSKVLLDKAIQGLLNSKIIGKAASLQYLRLLNLSSSKNELLNMLWFKDYIWEGVSSLMYEDILNSTIFAITNVDKSLWNSIVTLQATKIIDPKYRNFEDTFYNLQSKLINTFIDEYGVANTLYSTGGPDYVKQVWEVNEMQGSMGSR